MRLSTKTTVKPVITVAEQETIVKAKELLQMIADNGGADTNMIIDRDGDDMFTIQVAKNLISALDVLSGLELE